MKKKLLILISLTGLGICLTQSPVVLAEDEKVEELKVEITKKEEELNKLKDELKKLLGKNNSNEIILNQPMMIGNVEVTVLDYSLSTDYEGKNALIIDYKWTNHSDKNESPYLSFHVKGYQDGVETDDVFMVDGVNLENSQKEIKPGGEINAQTAVGFNDINKPLELEIEEIFSLNDALFTTVLDLNNLE